MIDSEEDAETAELPRKRAYSAVAFVAIGAGASELLMMVLPLMILSLEQRLSLSSIEVGIVIGAGGLGLTAVLLVAGGIADRLGYRRAFLLGIVVSILGALLASGATSGALLIAGVFVAGIGQGQVMVTSMAAIAALLPAARLAAFAVLGAIMMVIGSAGSLAAGVVAASSFDRWALAVGVPLSVVSVVGVARLTRNPPARRASAWDPLGMVLSVAASATLFVGISLLVRGAPATVSIAASMVGVLLFAAFGLWERSRREPMLNLAVLRNRSFAAVALTASLASFGAGGVFIVVVQYTQFVMDLDRPTTALIIAGTGLLDALAALASPAVMRLCGPRLMIGGALTFAAAICVGTTVFLNSAPTYMPVAASVLVSIAITLVIAPLRTLVADSLPGTSMGAGFGAYGTIRRFTEVIGMAIVVGVFSSAFAAGLHPALQRQGLDSQSELSVGSVGQALQMRARLVAEMGPEEARRILQVQHDVFLEAQRKSLEVGAGALMLAAAASVLLPGRRRRETEVETGG